MLLPADSMLLVDTALSADANLGLESVTAVGLPRGDGTLRVSLEVEDAAGLDTAKDPGLLRGDGSLRTTLDAEEGDAKAREGAGLKDGAVRSS